MMNLKEYERKKSFSVLTCSLPLDTHAHHAAPSMSASDAHV